MSHKVSTVNELANGLWHDIIPALTGILPDILTRKEKPCPSCGGDNRFVFDDLQGRGTWFCRRCGGRQGKGGAGDGISLVARINGWTFPQTVNAIGDWLHAPDTDFSNIPRYKVPRAQKEIAKPIEWEPLGEQPEDGIKDLLKEKVTLWNPVKGKSSRVTPNHVAIIRNEKGIFKGAVVRFEVPDKKDKSKIKKIPCQVMYCANKATGETKWVIHGLGHGRPLYGAETIGAAKYVLLVQGERKRDIVSKILKHPCVSIVGGDGAATSMDLSPLHGKNVLIWPDNDFENDSGMLCAKRIGEMLLGKAGVKIVTPPGESKPKGWDLGDAFTNDNWSVDDFSNYVKQNTVEYCGYDPESAIELETEIESEPDQEQEQEPKKKEKKEKAEKHPVDYDESHVDSIFPKFIRFLGFDGTTNYYYSMIRKQVLSYSASAHTKACLLQMVPEEIWQSCFTESVSESGVIKWSLDSALNYLNRKADLAGYYDPLKIRRGGCWMDDGRVVLHIGNELIIDGERVPLGGIKTDYIYEARRTIGFEEKKQATETDLKFINMVSGMISWKHESSAKFLVGWALIAPVCGILKFRPCMWLTGSSGCGKSTIFNSFLAPLLGGVSYRPQGTATEAGIRQHLNGDAVPVLRDESEAKDKAGREKNQLIITMSRNASGSESLDDSRGTPNGQSISYFIRSIFGFASINHTLTHPQDINRTTVLELANPSVKFGIEEAGKKWKTLENYLSHVDQAMGQRIILRTIVKAKELLESIEMMQCEVAKLTGARRLGDTYGTLLAGWWMSCHEVPPTEEEAVALAKTVDWTIYVDPELGTGGDAEECLSAIMQVQVRGEVNGRGITATIGEMIHKLRNDENENVLYRMGVGEKEDFETILARHGIRIGEVSLMVSNKSVLMEKGLADTQYGGSWAANLLRLKGARKFDKVVNFGGGLRQRAVEIPWETVQI